MAKAVAASLAGSGATFGTYASSNLAAFQQPTSPAGSNTVTYSNPWPQFPNFAAQGGTAVVPQVTVSGGTVSSITIGGGSSVGTSGTFGVNNTQPVVVTYSAAPTVTWSLSPWFQPDPRNAKTAVNV